MRVLYFSTGYGPHDHRFLTALAGTEHDVYFLRLEGGDRGVEDRPVPERVAQIYWEGERAPFRWSDVPKRVRALKRLLSEVRPDLIHAGPIQTCAFLATLSGFRPVLTMSWAFDLMQDADRNAWWQWVTRYTLRRSTYFVSDAQVTRSRAIALGMRAERTAVFPWGVDLLQFRPAQPKRQATDADNGRPLATGDGQPFVVLCNRSWEPRYGVDVLARAFAKVAAEIPQSTMILLGGGSQANLIRRILTDGAQLGRVHFGGQVSQSKLPQLYRQADLFVSPSHVDGSSVSLMEALACGTPVLVSDIPANREWVQDGVNGWLFKDGDSDELAERILWISSHAGERAAVARKARKTAEARADWPMNFEVLLQAYEETLGVA